MADWNAGSLEDDLRPRMFALSRAGQAFALATIVFAEGGPRPVGSQMVVGRSGWWGFLSGGCIEADVALHGREVIAEGDPRRLVYGKGSPFIDMRLPCGGRLEVLVERVTPDEPALKRLAELSDARRPVRWTSNGRSRSCTALDQGPAAASPDQADVTYEPQQRLFVIGSDAFALAIAEQGGIMDWETILIRPHGPEAPPPLPIGYSRATARSFLRQHVGDKRTAIAITTHDLDTDKEALVAALESDAGYVGLLGSRRRLPERLGGLRAAGVDEAALARIKAPIGLPLGSTNVREVAVAVVAEIVALRNCPPLSQRKPAPHPAVGAGRRAR